MAAVGIKNVGAIVNLGVKFVRRVLTDPFVKRRGREQIEADYAPDGVRSVSPEARELAPATRRCNGCGQCDAVIGEGPAPSLQLVHLGREAADASGAALIAKRLLPHAEAIERVCPEGVAVRVLLTALR